MLERALLVGGYQIIFIERDTSTKQMEGQYYYESVARENKHSKRNK